MAADNQLSVKIVVDASQLSAGMSQAASTVQSASAQIASSMDTATGRATALMNELIKGGATATQAAQQMREMGVSSVNTAEAFQAVQATAAGAATSIRAVGPAAEVAAAGVNNARAAMMGLNRELGLGGNRALSTFIAQSETLGPILSKAFTGIALVGFIQLAVMAGEKLSRLISDTFIFTQAEKDLAGQIIANNKTIQESYDRHIASLREISLIGLSREAADQLRLKYAEQDDAYARRAIASLTKQVAAETQKLGVMQQQADAQKKQFSYTGPGAAPQIDLGPGVKEQETLVNSLNDTLSKLQAKLWDTGDAVQKMNKTFAAQGIKDSEAALQKHTRALEEDIRAMKEMANADLRAFDERERLEKEAESALNKGTDAEVSETIRGARLKEEAERKFNDDRMKDSEEASLAAIAVKQKEVEQEQRLGQITGQQALAQLNALASQKLAIEMNYLNDRAAEIKSRLAADDAEAYARDYAEYSKLLSEKQKALEQFNAATAANTNKMLTDSQKRWQDFGKEIGHTLDSAFKQMFTSSQNFQTQMARLGSNLLADLGSVPLKLAEEWAKGELKKLALHSSFLTSLFGLDATNNAAKQALQAAANLAEVTSLAGVAGAAGYASAMASLPFPANLAAAPGVAAAAIAATEGVGSIASAAGGMWQVNSDQLALVHKNESIIPATEAAGLRNLVRGGGEGFSSAAGGGANEIHVHVHATDARGVADFFDRNSDKVISVIQRAQREFKI